jgi:hypothetical protein
MNLDCTKSAAFNMCKSNYRRIIAVNILITIDQQEARSVADVHTISSFASFWLEQIYPCVIITQISRDLHILDLTRYQARNDILI